MPEWNGPHRRFSCSRMPDRHSHATRCRADDAVQGRARRRCERRIVARLRVVRPEGPRRAIADAGRRGRPPGRRQIGGSSGSAVVRANRPLRRASGCIGGSKRRCGGSKASWTRPSVRPARSMPCGARSGLRCRPTRFSTMCWRPCAACWRVTASCSTSVPARSIARPRTRRSRPSGRFGLWRGTIRFCRSSRDCCCRGTTASGCRYLVAQGGPASGAVRAAHAPGDQHRSGRSLDGLRGGAHSPMRLLSAGRLRRVAGLQGVARARACEAGGRRAVDLGVVGPGDEAASMGERRRHALMERAARIAFTFLAMNWCGGCGVRGVPPGQERMAVASSPERAQGSLERLAFNQRVRRGPEPRRHRGRHRPLDRAHVGDGAFQRAPRLGLRRPAGVHRGSAPAPAGSASVSEASASCRDLRPRRSGADAAASNRPGRAGLPHHAGDRRL